MSKELFDLNYTKDLPKEIKEELMITGKKKKLPDIVLDLFELQTRLTIKEIMVALWRKHKLSKSKVQIRAALLFLHNENRLKKIDIETYEKIELNE
jgi:predicted nucleic acid-binding protein